MSLRLLLSRIPATVWWLAALAWACGIYLLSSHKGDDLPKVEIPYLDKVVHFGLFAIQSALLYIALRAAPRLRPLRAALLACAAASLYGGIDELHQLFTPGRSTDLNDWIADTLGASLVLLRGFARNKGTS